MLREEQCSGHASARSAPWSSHARRTRSSRIVRFTAVLSTRSVALYTGLIFLKLKLRFGLPASLQGTAGTMIRGMKTQGTVNLQTAKRTRLAKFGMISVCCVALLPLCGASQASKPATSRQQLWDIGSKSLFLSCTGTRHGPAVILESGRGRSFVHPQW